MGIPIPTGTQPHTQGAKNRAPFPPPCLQKEGLQSPSSRCSGPPHNALSRQGHLQGDADGQTSSKGHLVSSSLSHQKLELTEDIRRFWKQVPEDPRGVNGKEGEHHLVTWSRGAQKEDSLEECPPGHSHRPDFLSLKTHHRCDEEKQLEGNGCLWGLPWV